jgi:histidine triad (HIT) family protein
MECIFCKIIAGQAPATILYQDDQVTAFRDIHPVAPTHILIVPNRHIDSTNDVTLHDEAVLGHLFNVARLLARQEGVHGSGYRLVINNGSDAGQAVYHLHMHLLGGRRMRFG